MSQHDYVLDNSTGLSLRTDLNSVLAAIASNNSGDTAPTTMYALQFWMDTSGATTILKIRNEANSAWITLGDASIANLGALLLTGGTMTGALVARNNAAVDTPDITFTGDLNTGIYSPGAELMGLVASGVELLRADGVLGYVKLLGTKGTQFPSGTVAERPTGVNGILRYNTDTNNFEGYINESWQTIASPSGSVAEYAVAATYATNDLVYSAGVIYVSQTGSNLGNSLSDTTRWRTYTPSLASAALTFASSPYTLLQADKGKTFICDVTNGSIQINLMAAATAGDGFSFTVRDKNGLFSTGAFPFLVPNGAELIMGLNSNYSMQSSWGAYVFFTDGTSWFLRN